MRHSKKVDCSASRLSVLTASVIIVVKVSKKTVLKAKALSDSYRFCDSSNTHVCLLGGNILRSLCEVTRSYIIIY